MKIVAILFSKHLYGKERSNIEVYHLLKNKGGHNIIVLINKNADVRIKAELKGLDLIEIDCPDRYNKSKSIISFFYSLIKANIHVKQLLSRYSPDILFLNNEISIYDYFISICFFKGKIIYRIGDAPAYPHLRFYWYNSFVWKHFVIKKVDTLICISKYIMAKVKQTGRLSNKDAIIYNYPPTRRGNYKDNNSLYFPKNEDIITFGYIGQIIQNKGVDLFINAALEIINAGKKCRIYIAGDLDYDEVFGNKIRELINQSPNNIIPLNEIDNIESFYNNIDVLCVPSVKEEPLGNVIVEAKKYSIPCIIFPSGGMPELIRHKTDGYICKEKNTNSIKEGMLYYLNNPQLIKEHSNNAFMSINQLGIDRKTFENKWLKIFS